MNAWTGFRNLWYAGNYWVRWAILILAFWPICIAVVAPIGSQGFTATVALLPLLPIVLGLIAVFDPLVIAAVGNFALGRKVLTVLATIIGAELAVGVFFSAVPVANDRGLIPLALLVMIAIVFFVLSGIKGKMVSLLIMVLVGIAAIMFVGGRDKVSSKINALASEGRTYAVTAERETKSLRERLLPAWYRTSQCLSVRLMELPFFYFPT